MAVQLVENVEPPPEQPRKSPPAEPAPKPAPSPARSPARDSAPKPAATPLPVLTTAREEPGATAAPAASMPSVAPPIDAMPTPAAPPPVPSPEPVVAARYDADYLSNPKPAYPPLSQRLGEQGTVVLKVRVEPDGRAGEVQLEQSSGFARLDKAAVDAVRRWHFAPARRGAEAISSWVRVPMPFSLRGE